MNIQKALLIALVAFSSINSGYAKDKALTVYPGKQIQKMLVERDEVSHKCKVFEGKIMLDKQGSTKTFYIKSTVVGCNYDERMAVLKVQNEYLRRWLVLNREALKLNCSNNVCNFEYLSVPTFIAG